MVKHYLFKTSEEFNREDFKKFFSNISESLEFSYFDETSGDIIADEHFYESIDKNIIPIRYAIRTQITFLCSHTSDSFMNKLLEEAFVFFPNKVIFPFDIIMKKISFGNFTYMSDFKEMFKKVDHTLLETVGTYLRYSLDAVHTAKVLGLHRNTLNQRLDKFANITNLDIRDYHNALLLELYFQFF